jgi:hypothetical protein
MRFAIRNKSRLIESFGNDLYEDMIISLKSYFENNSEVETHKKDGYDHDFISVPGAKCTCQFAIVRQQYDVLTLAYYPASNRKK